MAALGRGWEDADASGLERAPTAAVPACSIPAARRSPARQGERPVPPPRPTDRGARFGVGCGQSNSVVYCSDTQSGVMKRRTARRIPSGSTDCIICKPYPLSCFMAVLFSALYVSLSASLAPLGVPHQRHTFRWKLPTRRYAPLGFSGRRKQLS